MAPDENDKTRKALGSAQPPWDELREQRVLVRVVEAQRRDAVRRRVAGGLAAVGAVVVVGALGLTASLWSPAEPPARIVGTAPRRPAASGSSLALADGSEAILSAGASVQVREQSEDRVALDQSAGEVLYDVRPNRARSFVVRLGKVEVLVVGTRFRLAWAGEWVRVHVEHGRVRVDDGARRVELTAGEEMRVLATSEGPSAAQTRAPDPSPDPLEDATGEASLPRVRSVPSVPSVESLLASADAARGAGRLAEAANALGRIATFHAGDPRVTSALFTLGRVERSRGRSAAAAAAFERCWRRSPRGPLAEDAIAEAATSWAFAGDAAKARSISARYLESFPRGTHAARMRALSD